MSRGLWVAPVAVSATLAVAQLGSPRCYGQGFRSHWDWLGHAWPLTRLERHIREALGAALASGLSPLSGVALGASLEVVCAAS